MSEFEIDEKTLAALGRLTDAEKECLHRRLRHQTAKEMALDLGISPHAVEKRLKMARTKLGLSSSLEAARLLAASEGYQKTGPHSADLAENAPGSHRWFTRKRIMGVGAMTLIAAIALIFTLQGESQAPPTFGTSAPEEMAETGGTRTQQDMKFVKASPERVEAYVRREFDVLDRDRSDFVELAEAPVRLLVSNAAPLEGDEAREHFVADFDKNGDGKISFGEFAELVRPHFLERGIPLIPIDLIGVPAKRGEAANSDWEPALAQSNVMPTPIEMRLMIATSFAHLDADGSGYMEGSEGPVSTLQGPQPVFRRDESGKLVDTGERVTKSVEELRSNFYRAADKDGDARVSRAEYEPWAIGNFRRSGIAPESRQAMNAPIEPQP